MNIHDIKDPAFLKTYSYSELESLAEAIRAFLMENISQTGGHLSSNLGAVEITIAMHHVFESPKDQLIFDVGHQGYTHKILTGRADQFNTLRKTDGLSGFLKRSESVHDVFEAGHSSTSLAAGAGMLFAQPHRPDIGHIVMMIGDGALASGTALEALNFMGHYPDKHPIIILNDNEMSISQNVGLLSKMLTKLRLRKGLRGLRKKTTKLIPKFMRPITFKIEKRIKGFITGQSMFEDLGYLYFGPLDGHDFKTLIKAFEVAKHEKTPCIIHLRTIKGKGYAPSESDTLGRWHGVSPFEVETGESVYPNTNKMRYSTIVATYLEARAKHDSTLHVITPAMIGGADLYNFQAKYPKQLIDVGIAEPTAITMATGLALKTVPVFVSIYSTFLQRAYDQVLHDLARHNVHVVLGIDRAGIVGGDGETHQGIYDIPMLMHIPNILIAQGKDIEELYGILNYAFDHHQGPIAVRYPRESIDINALPPFDQTPIKPSWSILTKGEKGTLITFGSMVETLKARIEKENLDYTLINARYIKPLDETVLNQINKDNPIVIAEESVLNGGLGAEIISYFADQGLTVSRIKRLGFKSTYIPQGDKETMLKRYGLDADSILKAMAELIA